MEGGRAAWACALERLREYVQRYQLYPANSAADCGARKLRSWVERQRTAHRLGTLQLHGVEYTSRLEALPGWRWRGCLPTTPTLRHEGGVLLLPTHATTKSCNTVTVRGVLL